MHIGKNNLQQDYVMGGQVLETTTEERDIGVTVTANLKPAAQCAKAARTASVVLGQIGRASHYRDKTTFGRLYKQYVRQHLEFACQAWSPWLQKDVEVLEKVQQRAVRMVGGLKGTTYQERLLELGLQSLEARRAEADLIMTYKVLTGKVKIDRNSWFRLAAPAVQQHTRAAADPLRLRKPRARLDIREHFFTVRMVDKWNELPLDVRAATDPLRLRKPRARLDIREQFFTVRVVDRWNELPLCVREAPTVQRFRTALRRRVGASVAGTTQILAV